MWEYHCRHFVRVHFRLSNSIKPQRPYIIWCYPWPLYFKDTQDFINCLSIFQIRQSLDVAEAVYCLMPNPTYEGRLSADRYTPSFRGSTRPPVLLFPKSNKLLYWVLWSRYGFNKMMQIHNFCCVLSYISSKKEALKAIRVSVFKWGIKICFGYLNDVTWLYLNCYRY